MSDTGTIRLVRKANFAASLRKLNVVVDGKKIGNIANGKQESFELDSGRHTVQVKLLLGSESLDVDLNPGDSAHFECGISSGFWTRLVVLFILFALSNAAKACLPPLGTLLMYLLLVIASIWILVLTFKPGAIYYLKRID